MKLFFKKALHISFLVLQGFIHIITFLFSLAIIIFYHAPKASWALSQILNEKIFPEEIGDKSNDQYSE